MSIFDGMSIFDVDANIEEPESYVKFKEAQEKMMLFTLTILRLIGVILPSF